MPVHTYTVPFRTTRNPERQAEMCRAHDNRIGLDDTRCTVIEDDVLCPFPYKPCYAITAEDWQKMEVK